MDLWPTLIEDTAKQRKGICDKHTTALLIYEKNSRLDQNSNPGLQLYALAL